MSNIIISLSSSWECEDCILLTSRYVLLYTVQYAVYTAVSISFYFCFQRYIDMRRLQYSSLSLALKTNYTRVKHGSIFSSNTTNQITKNMLKISSLPSDLSILSCMFLLALLAKLAWTHNPVVANLNPPSWSPSKTKFCMFTSLLLYNSSVPEAKTEIQYQPQYDFTEQFPANCIVIVREK